MVIDFVLPGYCQNLLDDPRLSCLLHLTMKQLTWHAIKRGGNCITCVYIDPLGCLLCNDFSFTVIACLSNRDIKESLMTLAENPAS